MSALVADKTNRWPGYVPYVIGELGGSMTSIWLRGKIFEFNTACRHDVFVPRREETDYIEIVPGGDSPIGVQHIGKQHCRVSATNLYHEMGHALGLGHTYYTAGCKIHTLFKKVDKTSYDGGISGYISFGAPNEPSMMAYSPNAFSTSPRIARVVRLTNHRKDQFRTVREHAQARKLELQIPKSQLLTTTVPKSVVKHKKTMDMDSISTRKAPVELGKRTMDLELFQTKKKDPDNINEMDLPAVEELLADLNLVEEYWTFDEGFMVRVHAADKAAVREVLGLPPMGLY